MGHRVHGSVNQRGATYLLLLVALALLSLVAATALSAGHSLAQRDKETELLFIGAQFRSALLSYEQHTPPGGKPRPSSLEQLLRDDRTPVPRRHLRRIFVDPISGQDQWGLIKDPAASIVGVHSLAEGRPVKQDKFESPFESFRASTRYSDWVFSPYAIVRSD
jgi:type II secretory pathway pseudopilin PulG